MAPRRAGPGASLHLGVDADTGQIAAVALTTKDFDDGAEVDGLLEQVRNPWRFLLPTGPFCRDQRKARSSPSLYPGSDNADRVRASQPKHVVQHTKSNVHFRGAALVRLSAQPVTDDLLVARHGRLSCGHAGCILMLSARQHCRAR